MENKNKNAPFNYLPVALLLSLAVVAGVVFSSIRNSGGANLLAMDAAGVPSTSNYNCENTKAKLDTGGYTAEEKAWYDQHCVHSTVPTYTCDGVSADISSGNYTAEEKTWYDQNCTESTNPTPPPPQYNCEQTASDISSGNYTPEEKTWHDQNCQQPTTSSYNCDELNSQKDTKGLTADEQTYYDKYCKGTPTLTNEQGGDKPTTDPCGYLQDLMAKYSSQPDSEQYVSAKKKFDLYCGQPQTGTNVCSDLRLKLETFIKNGQTDTDDYLKTKLSFTALCTEVTPLNDRCAELKAKLETYIQSGDSTSEGYASVKAEFLKSCQKPLPPAGFEDNVMTNFDQKDCPFSDSRVSELCGKAAMELYRRGVIGGFADGTFRGNELVNRAQAAKFLLLARFGVVGEDIYSVHDISQPGGEDTTAVHDISHGAWYERFVLRALHLGIISGYSDGTFRPGNGVNIAEFLKMLTLTFNLDTGLSYSFSDVHASDWFAKYAGIAEKYKLFPNNTSGKLDPGHKLTRCEVAIAIYEYLSNRT